VSGRKSAIPQVKAYITNQEEHHKRFDYQEEMKRFLEIHGFSLESYNKE
jgi:hypothetical protein